MKTTKPDRFMAAVAAAAQKDLARNQSTLTFPRREKGADGQWVITSPPKSVPPAPTLAERGAFSYSGQEINRIAEALHQPIETPTT
jgi:hypothetical protein